MTLTISLNFWNGYSLCKIVEMVFDVLIGENCVEEKDAQKVKEKSKHVSASLIVEKYLRIIILVTRVLI